MNASASNPSADSSGSASQRWRDRRVIVALSGGIACYKIATVVSRLVQAGAEVRVVMTESAQRFVGPLTFQSLSGHPVITSIWQAEDRPDAQHIGLARWAELVIVAPATANTIAKIANGICDDPVSLMVASLPRKPKATPVLVAPAMNADMWSSPIVQRNMATLVDTLGYVTVGPEAGWQACRTEGAGRMSEPAAIIDAAAGLLVNG